MTDTKAHVIEIIPFKRNEYDRGSRKIMVDGEEWGTIAMESHGCHGPSYHVSDLHGPVTLGKREYGPRKGEGREHIFHPKTAKKVRWENIGKTEAERVKPVPTDEQLRIEVGALILSGHLRSPEVTLAEITKASEDYARRRQEAEASDAVEFEKRARHAVTCNGEWNSTPDDYQVRCVIEAMRWAQTQ